MTNFARTTVFFAALMAAMLTVTSQNPYWLLPGQNGNYYSMQPSVSNYPVLIPNYGQGNYGYPDNAQGINPEFAYNMIADPSGNPLFYVIDGNILDQNGDPVDVLSWTKHVANTESGTCQVFYGGSWHTYPVQGSIINAGGNFDFVSGFSEACIVPNPANCQQYFIFTAGSLTADAGHNFADQPGHTSGQGGVYRFFDEAVYPFYAIYDMTLSHTYNNPVPGNLVKFAEQEDVGTPTGGNCSDPFVTVTSGWVNNNTKELFTTVYSSTLPTKQDAIYYAATDVIGSGSGAHNLVFMSDGNSIFCLNIDGTSPGTPTNWLVKYGTSSGYPLPNGSKNHAFRAEMEVVRASNGNFRLAVPFNGSQGIGIHVVEYNSSGVVVATGTDFILGNANGTPFIHGLEFSADGSKLFFSHETNGSFPNFVDYLSVSSNSGTITLNQQSIGGIPSVSELSFSQIELNTNGGNPMLYFATSANLISLDPSNLTASGWNTAVVNAAAYGTYNLSDPSHFLAGTTEQKAFLLPDQIDGANYNNPFQQTACCYAYGAFDVKAGSPYTAPLGTTVWSPGNNPWNSTTGIINVSDNITIPAGSNITIKNMTFKFTPTAKVTVMAAGCAPSCPNPNTCGNGGRLTLDNSVFTINNTCENNKMWPGVEVFGFNASGVCSQGTFANSPMGWMYMINNSKIEHALTGVRIGKTSGGLFGGGVLQTKNSRFENNQIDVDIRPCPNITANKTFFQSTIFQNTAALLDLSKNPITHVKSTDAIGINFNGCILQNMYASYYWASDGIQSNNSTIRINPLVTTFKNLRNGIWAQATPLSRTVYCHSAQFINNDVGAYLNVVDYATFYNNTFKVLDNNSAGNSLSGPLPYATGLYLENCTGFTVQGNLFQNNSVTPAVNSSYNYTFGCIVRNSALRYGGSGNINADNFIFKNTFKNINWGCQARDINYDMPNCQYPNAAGLKYYCNTFKSVIKDVEIGVSSGAIDYNQGYITGTNKGFASDNSFSKNNPNTFPWEFLHANTPTPPVPVGCPSGSSYSPFFSLNYIWSNSLNTVANPQPAKIDPPVGIQYVQSDDNTCGANPYQIVVNNPYTDLPSAITQYKAEVANISSKYDCGNTSALLNLIASNGVSGQVKNQLSSCTPFLSDQVLISYVNNTHYPDGDKQVILSACSPLSSNVMSAVQNSSLSKGTKGSVTNQQTGVSPATMIANQVSMLNSKIKWSYDEIIRTYLNDTITPGASDSARLWIRRSLSGAYYGKIIRLELDRQDLAAANIAYQNLVATEGPSSSNVKVHDALIKLHGNDVKQTLQSDQVMYNTLHQVYTDVATPDARLLAQSLLSYVDEIQPTPTYELMQVSNQRLAGSDETSLPTGESAKLMRCYPNPYEREFNIEVNVPKGTGSAQIVITSMLGEQIKRYDLVPGDNVVNFNRADLPSGMLLCSLIIDGSRVETTAMIKE